MREFTTLVVSFLSTLFSMTLVIISVLMYNWAGIDELLYFGWIVFGVGVILLLGATLSYRRSAGKEKDCDGNAVLNSGIFAVIRQPVYVSFMFSIVGLVFIGQNPLGPFIGIISIVLIHIAMLDSERSNIEKFGDEYRYYMQIVPRVNFVVGVQRLVKGEKYRAETALTSVSNSTDTEKTNK